ncbi:tRNA 2-selenouridine(34) synthase MnmH [Enterobacteriaceae bacterium 4M9]|nr:tRNA 2-selenouridine(34) synthase MnmH [Enterobacteriaceae bacterium 4M9]
MEITLPHRSDTQDYAQLLLADVPLLDVRAPVEFAQGALPAADNQPLMVDDERAAVGTCYKQSGQQAALALGQQLVSGATREARIAAWRAWCKAHPHGYICCARGGLRSHIVQQWLRESGIDFPLVDGGYRALRQYAQEASATQVSRPMLLVSGNTGCGKTLLVRELAWGVDLEGIARHRGSSFGGMLAEQPSQATFENHLAVTLLQKSQAHGESPGFSWVLEDEGAAIGSRHIPLQLRNQMQCAEIVVINDPFERRLARLEEEYFRQMAAAFIDQQGEEAGWRAFADYLRHGLSAIRRRLGLENYLRLNTQLEQALAQHHRDNAPGAHLRWLAPLLSDYYDPMYRYQLAKKHQQIRFEGTYEEVKAWLAERGVR